MALKRLQYVINACLLPVSKFIEHYENAILGKKGRFGTQTGQTSSECIFLTFRAGLSIRKGNRRKRLEQNPTWKLRMFFDQNPNRHHGFIKIQIYSNLTISFYFKIFFLIFIWWAFSSFVFSILKSSFGNEKRKKL